MEWSFLNYNHLQFITGTLRAICFQVAVYYIVYDNIILFQVPLPWQPKLKRNTVTGSAHFQYTIILFLSTKK